VVLAACEISYLEPLGATSNGRNALLFVVVRSCWDLDRAPGCALDADLDASDAGGAGDAGSARTAGDRLRPATSRRVRHRISASIERARWVT
jgi:hypothetical protein